jgi:hypothetical protein
MATERRAVKLRYGEECPGCGAVQKYAENHECHRCGVIFMADVEIVEEEPAPPPPKPPPGSKEYKVITQRDEFFKSKFNPEALQNLLNTYAVEGWRVVSMTTTDVGSFWGSFWSKGGGSSRQELIVLLERTVT